MADAQDSPGDASFGALLVEVVRSFTEEDRESAVLGRFAERARDLFGAQDAALLLADEQGDLGVGAATSDDARVLELLQVRMHDGPCVHAYLTGEPIVCRDPAGAAKRWPAWASEAARRGYAGVMAAPLRADDAVRGVLSVVAGKPRAFRDGQTHALQGLADTVAILLAARREQGASRILVSQLQSALDTRVVIEQAKGIVAAQRRIPPDQAFDLIRRYCRGRNLTLRDAAERIVGGDLRLGGNARGTANRRERHADLREHVADRREAIADERERIADERETAADRREEAADRREALLDALIRAGDRRDAAASRRDQAARGRDEAAAERDARAQGREQAGDHAGADSDRASAAADRNASAIDRDWAGRDRDNAAGDRSDLSRLARADQRREDRGRRVKDHDERKVAGDSRRRAGRDRTARAVSDGRHPLGE